MKNDSCDLHQTNLRSSSSDTLQRRATRALALVCAVLALSTAGCVNSIYPPFTDQEIVTNPAILGTWSEKPDPGASADASWTVTEGEGKSYRAVISEDGKPREYALHLFKLRGDLFGDLFPKHGCEGGDGFFVPSHLFFRIRHLGASLEVQALDPAWLGRQLDTNPGALAHLPRAQGEAVVITAPTRDLQRFLARHARHSEAWNDPAVYLRTPATAAAARP